MQGAHGGPAELQRAESFLNLFFKNGQATLAGIMAEMFSRQMTLTQTFPEQFYL